MSGHVGSLVGGHEEKELPHLFRGSPSAKGDFEVLCNSFQDFFGNAMTGHEGGFGCPRVKVVDPNTRWSQDGGVIASKVIQSCFCYDVERKGGSSLLRSNAADIDDVTLRFLEMRNGELGEVNDTEIVN